MVIHAEEALLRASMIEQRARLRLRELSATELVTRTLAEIDACNPHLNALVTLRPAAALAEAAAADVALARGHPRRLEGIPFTVKDLLVTAGVRTTAGSQLLRDYTPTWTATAVQRLQAAGAILLGKSNCSEFGMGNLHTGNRLFGETRNPWAADRTPGGSSGGDSAAVAAGLSSFGIGTDYGGSVRWPAHCTGIVSIRPTPGIVPTTGVLPHCGVGDGAPSAVNSSSFQGWIQTIGPLARGTADLVELITVMSGPDAIDAHAVSPPVLDPDSVDLRQLACAWFDDDGTTAVRPDIRAAVSAAAAAVRAAGMRVAAARPPAFDRAAAACDALRAAEGLPDHAALAAGRFAELTPLVRDGLRHAADTTASLADYRRLTTHADTIRAQILTFMHSWPILLLPVGTVPAFVPRPNEFAATSPPPPRVAYEACCRAVSLLRAPAAVVPCGTSTEGLPIGVQIVGRPYHDAEVLAVARVLEAAFGPWRPPPAVSTAERHRAP